MTSSMKSEPGLPFVRFGLPAAAGAGTERVEISAWATTVDGRVEAGARGAPLPSSRIAALAPSPVTAAAPVTATPLRNFRRSTVLDAFFFMNHPPCRSVEIAPMHAQPA